MSFSRQPPFPKLSPQLKSSGPFPYLTDFGAQGHPQTLHPGHGENGQLPPHPRRNLLRFSFQLGCDCQSSGRPPPKVEKTATAWSCGPELPGRPLQLAQVSILPFGIRDFLHSLIENSNRPPEVGTLRRAEGEKNPIKSVYLKQEVPPPSKFRLLEGCSH